MCRVDPLALLWSKLPRQTGHDATACLRDAAADAVMRVVHAAEAVCLNMAGRTKLRARR